MVGSTCTTRMDAFHTMARPTGNRSAQELRFRKRVNLPHLPRHMDGLQWSGRRLYIFLPQCFVVVCLSNQRAGYPGRICTSSTSPYSHDAGEATKGTNTFTTAHLEQGAGIVTAFTYLLHLLPPSWWRIIPTTMIPSHRARVMRHSNNGSASQREHINIKSPLDPEQASAD